MRLATAAIRQSVRLTAEAPCDDNAGGNHIADGMESIVYKDSPLAAYLEGLSGVETMVYENTEIAKGAGEGDTGWCQAPETPPSLLSDSDSVSFAPKGRPQILRHKSRGQPGFTKENASHSSRAAFWPLSIIKVQ